MKRHLLPWLAAAFQLVILSGIASAQVPQLVNYQGRVAVGTVNFNGTGQFKFALVNAAGSTTYWSNDGTSTAGSQPTAAVTLTVTKGLYSVLLGDTTLANMVTISNSVFANTDVRLRVWFNDGTNGSQLLTPDQRIAAVGYAMMAGNIQDGAITSAKIASGAVGSAQLAIGAAAANLGASGQSAVPGGGMILSANDNATNLTSAGYVKLGKVDLGDVWEQGASGGSPSARSGHTAVWTGSEMIVWGGGTSYFSFLNDGGRYNPASNSWTAVNTSGAPAARRAHTAVWTGSEMIVWGGFGGGQYAFNDGGRYNPTGNSWTAVTANPTRGAHTAVWTGSEMIVWGGFDGEAIYYSSGRRYNPTANSWTAVNTTGEPTPRSGHTAVWTGSEMIVWGGYYSAGSSQYLNDGGRYNPTANSWTAVTTTGAPAGRDAHSAVWTGSDMIVWGGASGTSSFNDSRRYNPASNSWTAVAANGALAGRSSHTAVWTGSEMIVWGGSNYDGGYHYLNDGGRYNPATNSWAAVTAVGAPAGHTTTAVWTGSEMIIWGGYGGSYFNDTFRYTPVRTLYLYQRP